MRRRRPASGLALALSLVVGGVAPAHSAWAAKRSASTTTTLSPRDARVKELRDLVGEASVQEGALLTEIADIEDRIDDLDDAVADLTRQAAAAQRRLDGDEATLARAEADQAAAVRRLAELQARADSVRQDMNQTVAAMYQRGTSEEQALYVTLVEGATSPQDLFSARHYVSGAIRSDRRQLDHFVALVHEADRLRQEVEDRAKLIRLTRDTQAAERDRLRSLRTEAVGNRGAARSEEARQEHLLAEVRDRRSDFQSELNALQVESGFVGDFLAQVQAGQRLAPRRHRTFRAPVDAPVSSGFGTRVHPILGDVRMHAGIDYAVGTGFPIRSAGNGFVVWAGPRGGYGNAVIIDHRNGLASLYAHQSAVKVAVGQKVSTGQVVGFVGQTGMSTGPHLHFEVRELGVPADPKLYL